MKDKILNKWEELWNDLHDNYNKIIVKDDYDNTKYTILYLNKNESFDKFKDLWEETKSEENCYDDTIYEFETKAKGQFDYFELDQLDLYTDREYELTI